MFLPHFLVRTKSEVPSTVQPGGCSSRPLWRGRWMWGDWKGTRNHGILWHICGKSVENHEKILEIQRKTRNKSLENHGKLWKIPMKMVIEMRRWEEYHGEISSHSLATWDVSGKPCGWWPEGIWKHILGKMEPWRHVLDMISMKHFMTHTNPNEINRNEPRLKMGSHPWNFAYALKSRI